MMMKKIAFAAALAATTAFAMPAYASTTDSTVISGDIALSCNIDGPANVSSVHLTGTTTLGNLTVDCNSAGGFTAGAYTTNSGVLKDTIRNDNPSNYEYELVVNGGHYSLANPVSYPTGVIGVLAPGAVSVPVAMNITKHNGANYAGHFQDEIHWTITAN